MVKDHAPKAYLSGAADSNKDHPLKALWGAQTQEASAGCVTLAHQ